MLRQRAHGTKEDSNRVHSNETDAQKSKQSRSCIKLCTKLIIGIFVLLYIIIPMIYYYSPSVRRHAVFLNYVSMPLPHSINEPQKFDLSCARNFYVSSEENIKLGVWHIPPKSALKRCKNGKMDPGTEFLDDRPVFLYSHGNSGTRAGGHRVKLYKLLSSTVDAHIITFDYRGYGDSTNVPPTADGVERDAMAMYKWLKQHKKNSQIYLWGHSLGTAVTVRLASKLCGSGDNPVGVILEAPFTSIRDASNYYPLSIFHRYMPLFDTFFLDPVTHEETHFDSEELIGQVTTPLLILHAQDDGLVPFALGEQLHKKALETRPRNVSPAIFVTFDYSLNYGHKDIHLDPHLPDVIIQFMRGQLKSMFIQRK